MRIWAGVVVFVVGVGAGLVGMQFVPPSVSPYLPSALQSQNEIVKGIVVKKYQEAERLLLTVSTHRGALLATFTKQIPEIDLLVEEGDEVTLGLAQYAPFVHDPSIKGVMKPDHLPMQTRPESGPDSENSQTLESEPVLPDPDVVDPKT
jgi:hypothetical protein